MNGSTTHQNYVMNEVIRMMKVSAGNNFDQGTDTVDVVVLLQEAE